MSKDIGKEWLGINIQIHNKLEELARLESIRKELIKQAEVYFNDEIKLKMNENIKAYERLLEEVRILNKRSEELKK